MTFREFLWARGHEYLDEKIQLNDFSAAVFKVAKSELINFYYIGGMPKAIKTFTEEKTLINVRNIQDQILQAYIADFSKYNGRIKTDRIAGFFTAIATQLGKKIIEMLIDARILLKCIHSNKIASKRVLKRENPFPLFFG